MSHYVSLFTNSLHYLCIMLNKTQENYLKPSIDTFTEE